MESFPETWNDIKKTRHMNIEGFSSGPIGEHGNHRISTALVYP